MIASSRDVQHALNQLGYGPLVEDGALGPKSKAATKRFQLDHPPLVVDGIAGPNTKAALSAALSGQ
jgi:peptidoglycan hydrolase-like protein with peptidoglycan-binding domain